MKGIRIFLFLSVTLLLAACSKENETVSDNQTEQERVLEDTRSGQTGGLTESQGNGEASQEGETEEETDYSEFFGEQTGCAVVYDKSSNTWIYFDKEKCRVRVSPCSTFKIVSALAGLEQGVLDGTDTKLGYDGTEYPIKEWNADLTLKEAFASSCVWYFRKVVDLAGKEAVQELLERLAYGNCDSSEWEGGSANPLPQLNGFWLESSLQISPEEQLKVLNAIFEEGMAEQEETSVLKEIMYIKTIGSLQVYGKTGTSGIMKNAWFTGFAESAGETLYISVHLDGGAEVSGGKAKEIAFQILENYGDNR